MEATYEVLHGPLSERTARKPLGSFLDAARDLRTVAYSTDPFMHEVQADCEADLAWAAEACRRAGLIPSEWFR